MIHFVFNWLHFNMDFVLFWVLLGTHLSQSSGYADITSESSSSSVTITNEDCSADVVVQNKYSYPVKLAVETRDDGLSLVPSTPMLVDEMLVIRMKSEMFSEETYLNFVFKDTSGSNVDLKEFLVIYREILSELDLSFADPTREHFVTNESITLTASVEFGEYITFVIAISNSTGGTVLYDEFDGANYKNNKIFELDFEPGPIPDVYTIDVQASTTHPDPALTTSKTIRTWNPLPPFELVLSPEHLTTSDDTIEVIPTEEITVTAVFSQNFSEDDTGTVTCTFDNDENSYPIIPLTFGSGLILPNATTSHTYGSNDNYDISVTCQTNVSLHIKKATVHVKPLTSYFRAMLENSLVPFNDDLQKGTARLAVWNVYEGDAFYDMSVIVDLGDDTQDRNKEVTGKDKVIYLFEYGKRGIMTMSVTFRDDFLSDKILSLNVTIGILQFAFEPNFLLSLPEKERMSFQILKLVEVDLTLLLTYAPLDEESVGMNALSSDTTLTKLYETPGVYRITVKTMYLEEIEIYVTQEFQVLARAESVIVNELFEIKYRDQSFPLPSRMSHIPTIAARSPVGVEGNQTHTLNFDWNLSRQLSSQMWQKVPIEQPHAINLVLQSFISSPGLYKIELRIDIVEMNQTASDYMYIDVEEESIVAIIKGGSLQTVSIGGLIHLDGSLSYDPISTISSVSDSGIDVHDGNGDDGNHDGDGLEYHWACFDLPTAEQDINKYTTPFSKDTSYKSFPACTVAVPDPLDTAVLLLNTSAFSAENSSWVLYELTVKKESREATVAQAVNVIRTQQPTVNIICFWNCEPKLVPEDRTVLHVEVICPSCGPIAALDVRYKWSLFNIDLDTGDQSLIPASQWPDEIESEESSATFDSLGGWWHEAMGYKVKVDVEVASSTPGTSELILYTNPPPYGGSCGVTPIEGIAGLTEFRFTATDWNDEGPRLQRDVALDKNPVLTYVFHQDASVDTPFIYSGGEISTPLKKLVACGTATGECNVFLHVIDPFKAVTECTMVVKVTEYINLMEVAAEDQIGEANNVINNLELQMSDAVKKQDPVKIVQDAATFGTILKSMSDPIETEEQFTSIDISDLDSDKGFSGLLDVDTAKEPLKDTLAEAGNDLILNTNLALNNAIQRNDVKDASQVEVFTKSLTSLMQSGEKYTTGPTINVASGSVKNLSLILGQGMTSSRVVRNIDLALNSIGNFMETIVDAMDIDVASLDPNPSQLGNDTGLTDTEIDYTATLLAKRRKFKLQSRLEKAPTIVKDSREIWDNMFHVTQNLQDSRGSYTLKRGKFQMALQKTSRKTILSNAQSLGKSESVLDFTIEDIELDDDYEEIQFQVVKTKNIFNYGKHSKYITSDIVIASMETAGNRKLTMKSPAVRHVVPETCKDGDELGLELITPAFIEGDAAQMFYHQFEYSNSHGKVCLNIRPTSDAIFYRLYAKVGSEPNDLNYDYRVTISKLLMAPCKEVCIPMGKLKGTGTAYIGLRPLTDNTQQGSRRKRSAIDPAVAPYMFGMSVIACYSWNDQQVDWIASKCQMDRNGSEVTCRCDGSSELINGLYFTPVPNLIHFGSVFSKFDIESQAAVLGTLIGLYLLFILLAIWAHYMDRRSILKWGVFPLADNYADEDYFYLITVHTGLRKGAGTTSNIGFSLFGDLGETGIRKLTDGVREGMPTGSVVHLVMAVPSDLGPLHYLRVWHDNSGAGGGGSWYLDKIVVVDLQNGDSFKFFNQSWMCPEENTMDVVVLVSNPEEVKIKEMTFSSTATKQVTEDHMWLSVLIRPERSRFNRLERVGCCLAFLLLSMIASAMFYQGANDVDREQPEPDLQIGALRLSWQQMYYSLVAAVITSVPIFLIVIMFRKARFRVEDAEGEDGSESRSCGCRRKSATNTQTTTGEDNTGDDPKDVNLSKTRWAMATTKEDGFSNPAFEKDNDDIISNLIELKSALERDGQEFKRNNGGDPNTRSDKDLNKETRLATTTAVAKKDEVSNPAFENGHENDDLIIELESVLENEKDGHEITSCFQRDQVQSQCGNVESESKDHAESENDVSLNLGTLENDELKTEVVEIESGDRDGGGVGGCDGGGDGKDRNVEEGLGEVEPKTKNKMSSVVLEKEEKKEKEKRGPDDQNALKLKSKAPLSPTHADDSQSTSLNACCARAPWMKHLEAEIRTLNKILLIRPAGRQQLDGSWPSLTRHVAWVTIFVSVVVCSFFIVLYSMEWGKSISEEWLSTFFLSFLQSLIVVDPSKVVMIALVLTLFIRKDEFVGNREINMKIVHEVNKEYGVKEKSTPPRTRIASDTVLKAEELHEATLQRKVRVLVRHTLMELAIHGVLLILVCSLCYANRSTLDYRMQETVQNSLIGGKYNGFKYVNSTKMYYNWLENVVTPWLFPKTNYKGESILSEDRYFTADWSLYRLGAPRFRQLRMPVNDCPSNKIKSLPCIDSYSMYDEVTREFCYEWRLPLPCPSIDQLRVTAGSWYFRSSIDLWGIPISGHQAMYGGGGYVTNLDINAIVASAIVKEAKNSFWIDRHTRAVFLEFTLYNPNTDRFIRVLLLAEILASGGVITYSSAYPFAPYPPRGALGQYISVCEIAAILFTGIGFVYIVHELKIHRKAVLRNFWFMVDILVFLMATSAISMYSMRLTSLNTALSKMREDPTKFVNFQHVIIWDFGFIVSMAFLIALTSFRLLKLAGYSKRTMRVYEVLRLSLGVLPGFMLAIWIVLSSFAITGYVLFHTTSSSYKTYYESVVTLFLGVLGKTGFRNTGLPPAGFHITFFYIILFGCIVNIFLANCFIAVLLEILTVGAQRDCPAVSSEKAKVFQLVWESFVYLFSKKHPPVDTLREHYKTNDKNPDEIVGKVAEEFEEWITRLDLKQKLSENNKEHASSVALYNKVQKRNRFSHAANTVKLLSSIVNQGMRYGDNKYKESKILSIIPTQEGKENSSGSGTITASAKNKNQRSKTNKHASSGSGTSTTFAKNRRSKMNTRAILGSGTSTTYVKNRRSKMNMHVSSGSRTSATSVKNQRSKMNTRASSGSGANTTFSKDQRSKIMNKRLSTGSDTGTTSAKDQRSKMNKRLSVVLIDPLEEESTSRASSSLTTGGVICSIPGEDESK